MPKFRVELCSYTDSRYKSILEPHTEYTSRYRNGLYRDAAIEGSISFLEHTTIHDPVDALLRPRFVRWDSVIMYSEKEVTKLFRRIRKREDFLLLQFPTACTIYRKGKSGESSSRTNTENNLVTPSAGIAPEEVTQQKSTDEAQGVVDMDVKEKMKEDEEAEEEFASSSHTSIARRVQRRVLQSNTEELLGNTKKILSITRHVVVFISKLGMISRYYCIYGSFLDRSDVIYQFGDVIIYRSQIDELLKSEYLDTNHVDAFGNFLVEKSKQCPGLYEPFLFVSSLHWAYNAYKVDTIGYVSHITKESVSASNFMLVPIIEQSHWTLLVGNLKMKISHLYDETSKSFETDIREWPVQRIKSAPTQKNNVDCGMYVCKYMEAAIQSEPVVWVNVIDWQDNMPKFRIEFVYAILTTTIE
ncbi:hypothetical protein IEQ34_013047 [Dendrobium chrysotoxum]|uniref:Ubiquitin-like protease family profile domain-containing protein n=1 Tax=Dendrobium chrysotoxum TaxID=161865 RepID=A0AAV7GNW5_DENCH|nr:hypothetical protein IEQ34_013047 [Dendrobium chrysotoxum]